MAFVAKGLKRCHLSEREYCDIATESYRVYLHSGFFQSMMELFHWFNSSFDLSITLWVSKCGGLVLKSPPVHKILEDLQSKLRSPIWQENVRDYSVVKELPDSGNNLWCCCVIPHWDNGGPVCTTVYQYQVMLTSMLVNRCLLWLIEPVWLR